MEEGGPDCREQNGGIMQNAPFEPWYNIQVARATKNGEVIHFDIETEKLEEHGARTTVQRVFDDFEWLQHCLVTDSQIGGIIMPPLPIRPLTTAADAVARTKKELGTNNKLKGDEYHKDCRTMEKYLRLVVRHSVLGKSDALAKFLTEKEPPVRAKLKKSLLTNLSKAVGEVRLGSHSDVDPSFQKERNTVNDAVKNMKNASENFYNMLNAQERFSACLNHLSTALCLASPAVVDGPLAEINKMQLHFAKSIEHYSHGMDVFTLNNEKTLGFCLDLYARYLESEKTMLFGRTCKLVEFEQATKTLDKAKPLKRDAALAVKEEKEAEFKEISAVANKEISVFHRQRIVEFQKALILYAEAKIKTARDISALVAKDISTLKQMEPYKAGPS